MSGGCDTIVDLRYERERVGQGGQIKEKTNPGILPYIYDGMDHTPQGRFPSSIARQQKRGCQHRTIPLLKASGEMCPTSTSLAPTLFQLLWRYQSWKIGRGGVRYYTIVYGTRIGTACINGIRRITDCSSDMQIKC